MSSVILKDTSLAVEHPRLHFVATSSEPMLDADRLGASPAGGDTSRPRNRSQGVLNFSSATTGRGFCD